VGKDKDLIRAQIARTRDEMGAIIDAIAYKADVQARAKDRVSDAVDRVKDAVSGTASSIKERAGRDSS
jgi:LPS O-antigen subunit length determinant protein (WzzB/FepE family)